MIVLADTTAAFNVKLITISCLDSCEINFAVDSFARDCHKIVKNTEYLQKNVVD